MDDNSSAGDTAGSTHAFRARVEAAALGTPYRVRRTERGFDLVVDIDAPQWQELLIRSRITRVHTYRVALHPEKQVFTMTDLAHEVVVGEGIGGVRLGMAASVGRSVSFTSHRSLNGPEEYTFSSAEGHRLIRGAAGELGWREAQPLSVKIGVGVGLLGGICAVGVLIALAVVKVL